MRPLDDKVVVEPLNETDVQTKGGIYIPQTAEMRAVKGKVLLVGRGKYDAVGNLIPPQVSPGDTVLYQPHNGTPFEFEGRTVRVLNESFILVILEHGVDRE